MNTTASMGQNHEQFLQLVFSISKIQHANIVKLMGYCAELAIFYLRQRDIILKIVNKLIKSNAIIILVKNQN